MVYVKNHAETGIFLDTNVLLLFLVNQFMPRLIGIERLKAYRQCDADLLTGFVGRFARVLTTPHVLAETSNFARQMVKGRLQTEFLGWLHPLFCAQGQRSFSQTTPDGHDIDKHLFARLGLTDAALVASANIRNLLLPADLDLHVATLTQGGHSINFTHMREAAGLL